MEDNNPTSTSDQSRVLPSPELRPEQNNDAREHAALARPAPEIVRIVSDSQVVGIVGEDGCGKATGAKVLANADEPRIREDPDFEWDKYCSEGKQLIIYNLKPFLSLTESRTIIDKSIIALAEGQSGRISRGKQIDVLLIFLKHEHNGSMTLVGKELVKHCLPLAHRYDLPIRVVFSHWGGMRPALEVTIRADLGKLSNGRVRDEDVFFVNWADAAVIGGVVAATSDEIARLRESIADASAPAKSRSALRATNSLRLRREESAEIRRRWENFRNVVREAVECTQSAVIKTLPPEISRLRVEVLERHAAHILELTAKDGALNQVELALFAACDAQQQLLQQGCAREVKQGEILVEKLEVDVIEARRVHVTTFAAVLDSFSEFLNGEGAPNPGDRLEAEQQKIELILRKSEIRLEILTKLKERLPDHVPALTGLLAERDALRAKLAEIAELHVGTTRQLTADLTSLRGELDVVLAELKVLSDAAVAQLAGREAGVRAARLRASLLDPPGELDLDGYRAGFAEIFPDREPPAERRVKQGLRAEVYAQSRSWRESQLQHERKEVKRALECVGAKFDAAIYKAQQINIKWLSWPSTLLGPQTETARALARSVAGLWRVVIEVPNFLDWVRGLK